MDERVGQAGTSGSSSPDPAANSPDRMMGLVYAELRRIAASYLRRERPDHTLQPTALVHEAFIRLVDQRQIDWSNRAQFMGLAAVMMRRILVNHARDRVADKRGGGLEHVPLTIGADGIGPAEVNLLDLHEALECLAKDEVVCAALGSHIYERFVEAKREEWEDYIGQVSEWELRRYLGVY